MPNLGYSRFIRDRINSTGYNIPILNSIIAKKMADKYALDLTYAQRIVNQNMKRLADQEIVVHFAKGVYYKPVITPFGRSVLNKTDYYYRALTCPNGEHIGYEGCPSVLNTIGLCSVMTAEKNIVTNLHRKSLPGDIRLTVEKPRASINEQNYRYFQLADILCGMKKYLVDANEPRTLIDNYMREFNIEPLKLIAYAKKYYTENEFETITDYLTEGLI